jgi:hypothetical protein
MFNKHNQRCRLIRVAPIMKELPPTEELSRTRELPVPPGQRSGRVRARRIDASHLC